MVRDRQESQWRRLQRVVKRECHFELKSRMFEWSLSHENSPIPNWVRELLTKRRTGSWSDCDSRRQLFYKNRAVLEKVAYYSSRSCSSKIAGVLRAMYYFFNFLLFFCSFSKLSSSWVRSDIWGWTEALLTFWGAVSVRGNFRLSRAIFGISGRLVVAV